MSVGRNVLGGNVRDEMSWDEMPWDEMTAPHIQTFLADVLVIYTEL